MSHYHDENDLKLLKEMSELSPEELSEGRNLENADGRECEQLPGKYRELIALALAVTTECPYCVEAHTTAAKLAGVKREEISETAFLAVALCGGGAAKHGAMALRFFDQEATGRSVES